MSIAVKMNLATSIYYQLFLMLIVLSLIFCFRLGNSEEIGNCSEQKRMQVYCIFGLWYGQKYDVKANNIDHYLCNQIILAYVYIDYQNEKWTFHYIPEDPNGFLLREVIAEGRKSKANTQYLVSFGGWVDFTYGIGSAKYRTIANDLVARESFFKTLTVFLQINDLDGVDFYWNFIGRENGVLQDLQVLAIIASEMCKHMRSKGYACSITLRPLLWDSIAYEDKEVQDVIKEILRSADVVHLNTGEIGIPRLMPDSMLIEETNPLLNTPLYRFSVNSMIDYMKGALDTDLPLLRKLSLIIPMQWRSQAILKGIEPKFDQERAPMHPVGGDNDDEWQYPYLKVCERLGHHVQGEELIMETLEGFPVAYSPNYANSDIGLAIFHATQDSVQRKVNYARKETIGAVTVFQIGADDVHGWCHNQSYPLLTAIRNAVDVCSIY